MFTGRENEVGEYSKLITDESTRLLNIWGSPGFGKTSTAIGVAHYLSSLGYPVYFFKLQGITTIDRLQSKMLSIFQSSLVDVNLAPIDKLVRIFREISSPVILILDNIDDLLSSETSPVDFENVFVEFLDSNSNINIILTTRELLEDLRDQVKGFQDVRIRPLSPVSSVKFVRQLLPSFSENVVTMVAETSCHVPLAIRLVASLIKNSSEEMANKVLEELQSPENRLKHFEKHMQKLFDKPFGQLATEDKHALISLTVFTSATINKDAAIAVVSGEGNFTLNALQSLNTLVKKALIDVDPNGKYYSIHPLIYSFIAVKAKENDFENVLNSSNICFCSYYLLLFERLNDDFLAGKSVDNPQLEDVMECLSTVMHQSLMNDSENAHHVFRILSKAEIFLFMVLNHCTASDDVIKLFNVAIQKSTRQSDDVTYLKLYVSSYFRNIAFSLFVVPDNLEIPEENRIKIEQLSDGTAAKLSCCEGILNICNGNVQNGIEQVEMSLHGLQSCPDQLLLKCLCLQVLTLYHNNQNELEKSCEFMEMAAKVSMKIGNCNLLLIGEPNFSWFEVPKEDVGEPLVLFTYLLTRWSSHFLGKEEEHYVYNFLSHVQQQIEMEARASNYSFQILIYGDVLLSFLSISIGQEALLDKRIEFLSNSFGNCSQLTDKVLPNTFLKNERLLQCYSIKGGLATRKDQKIEAYRKALDLSIQENGEHDMITAGCYYDIGKVENAASNYSSALEVLDKALTGALSIKPDYFGLQGDIYYEKGIAHYGLGNYELAISSFEKALDVRKESLREQSEENRTIANILYSLSLSQLAVMDMTSALATAKRALDIRIKLFSEKCIHYLEVVQSYQNVGNVHAMLNNHTGTVKCLEEALNVLNGREYDEECLFHKCLIYLELIRLNINENFYVELLDRSLRSLHAVKENNPHLPIFYLTVGSKQSIQESLNLVSLLYRQLLILD